jgi:hypothetical protein
VINLNALVTYTSMTGAAVKQARSATKVLFDSDYASVDVPEFLSAMEADPKMVYLDESELFTTPLIKLGVAVEFFTSICACHGLASFLR